MRISRNQMLMTMAVIASQRSTCSRANVGTVIAVAGRVVATGYNGAPAGMPHCDHACPCQSFTPPPRGKEYLVDGTDHTEQCPIKPCTRAVHAESNAIAFAAKFGVPTFGGELFTTMAPCVPCSQIIINAGISSVWYWKPYRDMSGVTLLSRAGVTAGIVNA